MRPDRAERIVNEYGGVIEKELGSSTIAPESALRYPKATIREAILTYAAALHKMNALHEIRGPLATGYMHLADFVPDADALHARRVEAAMMSSVVYLLDIPESESEQYNATKRQAVRDGSLLLAEFHGFEKGIGAKPYDHDLLAELRIAKEEVEDVFGVDRRPDHREAPE